MQATTLENDMSHYSDIEYEELELVFQSDDKPEDGEIDLTEVENDLQSENDDGVL